MIRLFLWGRMHLKNKLIEYFFTGTGYPVPVYFLKCKYDEKS